MAFFMVLKTVAIMLFFIICGYTLVKSKKAEASHAKGFSALLVYLLAPCLMISSFQKLEYTPENFRRTMIFFCLSLIIQALFIGIMLLFIKKKYSVAKNRVMTVAATLGNVGFFGLPIITSVFPNESVVACYSTAYVASMNLLCFTIGIFLISNDKKFISFKGAFLNPTTLSFIVAVTLYVLNFKFNETTGDMVNLLGRMTTPVCMIVVGFRLASMNLKDVFTAKFAYLSSLLKLIVFPLFAVLCVAFLPFVDNIFKISMFILSSAPTGVVVLSLAELHECEQKITANAVLLTTLLSLISIPLMLLFVNV